MPRGRWLRRSLGRPSPRRRAGHRPRRSAPPVLTERPWSRQVESGRPRHDALRRTLPSGHPPERAQAFCDFLGGQKHPGSSRQVSRALTSSSSGCHPASSRRSMIQSTPWTSMPISPALCRRSRSPVRSTASSCRAVVTIQKQSFADRRPRLALIASAALTASGGRSKVSRPPSSRRCHSWAVNSRSSEARTGYGTTKRCGSERTACRRCALRRSMRQQASFTITHATAREAP